MKTSIVVYPFSTLPQNAAISSELLENYVFSCPIIYFPSPMRNIMLTLQK